MPSPAPPSARATAPLQLDLAGQLRVQARANRLANHRLHAAMAALPQDEFDAPRTGFFPSLAATLNHILDGEKVLAYQGLVRRVPVPDHIYAFAVDLVRRTRPASGDAPAWLKPLVGWGAGPRAVQYLILGAKARAALLGSYMVRMEDIAAVAEPVLRHRVMTTFTAESEGVTSLTVAKRLVEELRKEG